MVDLRPSGTRLRIAKAIGKHKSFVSQITSPGYAMPVPAKYLGTILDLCHGSPDERATLLAAYRHAHPGRRLPESPETTKRTKTITLEVPLLEYADRQAEMVQAIRRAAAEIGSLAVSFEAADRATESSDNYHRRKR